MNVWNLLEDAASQFGDQTALVADGHSVDYRDLRERALAMAGGLAARGVQPGDRVGCLMHNTPEHLLAYFGIAAAGAVLVSLNTRLVASEQQHILQHAGAKLLLHDEAHAQRSEELDIAGVAAHAAAAEGQRAEDQRAEGQRTPLRQPTLAAADDPAQLYYTSGTTGSPKGVVLTHANVCRHAHAAIAELQLSQRDTWAHIAPMFHLADAWATFAITAVGGRHVFLPVFAPDTALDLLQQERVTITNLVPTMLNLMVKQPDAADRDYALRVMLSGGAPIAPDVVRRIIATFACEYVQTYGMTETSPYLTMSLLSDKLRQLPEPEQLRLRCKTGRAFQGVELRVVGSDGRDVPADGQTVGEIRVRGATVTPGYWHNAAATREAFDEQGFLHTGDLANIDHHGFVDIVDRLKDVIKTGAETVYSVEVENVLYEHPAVLECAVFGRPDETWGERVCAAVVLRPEAIDEAAVDTAELTAFVRERLAGYKTPKQLEVRSSLPRTGSGKIQKRALRG
ncbi:MAG: long-chain-fatty-acid--CoA ligase [Planctomycetota bacterium]